MMSRLVTLSFDGLIASGLKVTIKISEELGVPYLQETGLLPQNPQIVAQYDEWRKTYQALEKQTRTIKVKAARLDSSTAALRQKCRDLSIVLQTKINAWLDDPGFNPIRRVFYREISQESNTRVLIQSDDPQLWLLPWHLWRDLEDYPRVEFSFSKINYSKPTKLHQAKGTKVRILAVFGDNSGIDTTTDQAELNQVPDAEVEVLQQPSRQEFSAKLWEQPWDVLFFAGHSRTTNTTGYLQLNQTDSLTMAQLKHSLRKAIEQGLQLAIFNSCDGLGLAWELDELNIPQVVLMREIVPDVVAQSFLQYFLADYSTGTTLYTAVRQARDRLESLENTFPCATWLPVIYQNPAFFPPTWSSLREVEVDRRVHRRSVYQNALLTFVIGVGVTTAVLGLRFSGFLQPLELKAYDGLVHLTPRKLEPDSNILIIQITEDDLNIPAQQDRIDSLSPTALHQLLTILNRAKASVIGLDIYRDQAANLQNSHTSPHLLNRKIETLHQWADTASPLVTLCRVKDIAASRSEVSPPPNFPITSVGFSDQTPDPDGVVRRYLLAMKPEAGQCVSPYALSVQLALRYLANQDDNPVTQLKFLDTGAWKLGRSTLMPLKLHEGAYHNIDPRGMQLLLNYRLNQNDSLSDSFETVTLSQILNGKIADQVIKGRIVLIGTTAESYKDYHETPFGQKIPGVMLQAHMTSYLIDVALGHRSLTWTWPLWVDSLWIASWTTGGVLLAMSFPKQSWRYASLSMGIILLGGCCWGLFVWLNGWVPLIPSIFGLAIAGVLTPKVIQTWNKQTSN